MRKIKGFKKIIISTAVALMLITSLSVTVFASDDLSAEDVTTSEETAVTEENGDEARKDENSFTEIYEMSLENSDKIFSLLAFIGTLIVSGAYKKGLIPTLKDALARLSASIEATKRDSVDAERRNEEKFTSLEDSVRAMEAMLCRSENALSRLEGEMSEYTEVLDDHERMRILFSYQIDMLYSIFMSSSLPEYQKEEIGIKISKMREELANYDKQGE